MPVRLQRLGRLVFFVSVAVIAAASLLPSRLVPDAGISDKIQHLAAYSVLGFLGTVTAAGRRRMVCTTLGLIGIGSILELLQAFSPGRSPEVADAVVNAAGAGVGYMIAMFCGQLPAGNNR